MAPFSLVGKDVFMTWVVIATDGRGGSAVYSSEEEAEHAAAGLAETVDEDTWVAICDQQANKTRVIKIGDDS